MCRNPYHIICMEAYSRRRLKSSGIRRRKNRLTQANIGLGVIAAAPFMILHMAVGETKITALVVVAGRHISPPGVLTSPGNATIVQSIRMFIKEHPGISRTGTRHPSANIGQFAVTIARMLPVPKGPG